MQVELETRRTEHGRQGANESIEYSEPYQLAPVLDNAVIVRRENVESFPRCAPTCEAQKERRESISPGLLRRVMDPCERTVDSAFCPYNIDEQSMEIQ